jgi:hypothetical protein
MEIANYTLEIRNKAMWAWNVYRGDEAIGTVYYVGKNRDSVEFEPREGHAVYYAETLGEAVDQWIQEKNNYTVSMHAPGYGD